ncbi:MAG TPA: glycosyl hydrolase family 65 protein [Mycobacteriales bacterium]|nr:glycosyl hydrolase family 65 protein [Mycobacteriales bacterium]
MRAQPDLGAPGVLAVEPWRLRETELDLGLLARTESLFALSNGHVGVRGTLDEGEPHVLPGSYLNSVFELRPLPHAEAGYGYPESGQTVINVTNGKLMRLLVDDEPFDVRYGTLRSHERTLDFRTGTLVRECEWESPAGRVVTVRSTRLVSFTQRAILGVAFEVEAVDAPVRVVVQSELVADEEMPDLGLKDPRVAAALGDALVSLDAAGARNGGYLVHRTRRSGITVAAAMENVATAPGDVRVRNEHADDWVRVGISTELEPGQALRVEKLVSYGWSSHRSMPAVRDQVAAALTAACSSGWERLVADQKAFLEEYWAGADVEVDGDPELQQAVRFAMFHVLQSAVRTERRPIPAKGLTGPGYDGHAFWDTETFVLPLLIHTLPDAAASALMWRHDTLPLAVERAHTLGLEGATFPWRTITGEECSGYWPAGTAAFHVNADIADATIRYINATGDERFEREVAFEILVHTARLWCSLGHHGRGGEFRIDGVTGPDEYTAVVDNNVFTNLMAQRNLVAAAAVADRHHDLWAQLDVTADELEAWRAAAVAMYIPYDDELRVHPQSDGFLHHEVWDFEGTDASQYPLLLHFPYFDLYRKQVVKQADLLLALHLCGSSFTLEEKRRSFEYYEPLTVRDSSLSACTQAVIAAEVGHLDLAYDYAGEAALMDLQDLAHKTRDGLHMASLAGAWNALVAGFGGMRDHVGQLSFAPRLPRGLERLAFRMLHRGRRIGVEVVDARATYTLLDGPAVDLFHHGRRFHLTAQEPVVLDVPPAPELTAPSQPAGRAPERRGR